MNHGLISKNIDSLTKQIDEVDDLIDKLIELRDCFNSTNKNIKIEVRTLNNNKDSLFVDEQSEYVIENIDKLYDSIEEMIAQSIEELEDDKELLNEELLKYAN